MYEIETLSACRICEVAPQHPWLARAQDLGAAVRWVGENIAAHGGDPARVFLMGHSAGAVHVASYVAHRAFHGPRSIDLAGAILVSGRYDLTSTPAGPPEKAYFGEDASKYAERSSLAGLVAAPIPLLVAYAELDPPNFQQQAKQLNEVLCKAGRCPRLVTLAKHSHISEVYAINTKDTGLSGEILGVCKEVDLLKIPSRSTAGRGGRSGPRARSRSPAATRSTDELRVPDQRVARGHARTSPRSPPRPRGRQRLLGGTMVESGADAGKLRLDGGRLLDADGVSYEQLGSGQGGAHQWRSPDEQACG